MLKGISPLLTADLLHVLASMGHGDEIVLADANFPAATHARRLVSMPGVDAPQVLDAVLSVLPLDDFVDHAALTMQVVGDAVAVPQAVRNSTRHCVGTDMAPARRWSGLPFTSGLRVHSPSWPLESGASTAIFC